MLNSNLENCLVGIDDVLIASALTTTIIVVAPLIERVVNTVVTTVVSWVRSFWSWLCGLFTQKTTTYTTTTVTEVYTPRLKIGNTCYNTVETTVQQLLTDIKYKPGDYYLCFVGGGKVYISIAKIKIEEAIAILMNCYVIKLNNTEVLASTFTKIKNDAYKIATAAGLDEARTPYNKPEKEYGAYHYHTIAKTIVNGKEHSPHSFFICE